MKTPNRAGSDNELPLVSCIMPTYGRPDFVCESIQQFLDQDYPNKELIVLNDCGTQQLRTTVAGVHIENARRRFPTLGEKRNTCIEMSQGDYISVWDDDDVYLPWRLSASVHAIRNGALDFYRPAEFWAYWGDSRLHHNRSVPAWVNHSTVTYSKRLWRQVKGYPCQDVGEDAEFFRHVHHYLNRDFIAYPIREEERFMILRGKSKYRHTSMEGGERPPDTSAGVFDLVPCSIGDDCLREVAEKLIRNRLPTSTCQLT